MPEKQNIKNHLSWWEYDQMLKDIDYTIIGGGIVGLSTAIEIKKTDFSKKVLIVDKKSLPFGASTKNAGFACFGSISEIMDDYNLYGEQVCQKLIKMRWKGLSILKSRVPAATMNYKPKPGAEIFQGNDEFDQYVEQIGWANKLVAPVVQDNQCFSHSRGPFGSEIVNRFEGCLNPQKMMSALEIEARKLGVSFIYGFKVNDIDFEQRMIVSDQGSMGFNQLVVCTNGFTSRLLSSYDVKPARNQVLITEKIDGFSLDRCYHMNKGYVYFREIDGRLLLGGGRDLDKEGETTDQLGSTALIEEYLNDLMDNHILKGKEYTIAHRWSGILGVGASKMPIVERINDHTLLAVRMGGMGVAIGSFIGEVVTAMLFENDNSAHRLFVT